jgi:hypothetical protein
VSRFAIVWLRVLGSLGAGAAAWTTFWLIRGGEPGPAAYVASLAASLAVYVASTNPPPRPWGGAHDAEVPDAAAPPAGAPAPPEPAEAPGPLR